MHFHEFQHLNLCWHASWLGEGCLQASSRIAKIVAIPMLAPVTHPRALLQQRKPVTVLLTLQPHVGRIQCSGSQYVVCLQWSMWDRIQAVRNQELGTLWRSFIVQALFGFTLNTIPVLVSVLTFGVYVLLGNKLTAAEAFTSLSLFTVRGPYSSFAALLSPACEACAVVLGWLDTSDALFFLCGG